MKTGTCRIFPIRNLPIIKKIHFMLHTYSCLIKTCQHTGCLKKTTFGNALGDTEGSSTDPA